MPASLGLRCPRTNPLSHHGVCLTPPGRAIHPCLCRQVPIVLVPGPALQQPQLPPFAAYASIAPPHAKVRAEQAAGSVYCAPTFAMPLPTVHVSSLEAAHNRVQCVLR